MDSSYYLLQHIEALIFASEQAITLSDLITSLEKLMDRAFEEQEILEHVEMLQERYRQDLYAIELVEISDGYRYMTKGAFHDTVGIFLREKSKKRLSRVALETLAIIAYKQPVVKSDLEKIRGVNCDYAIQKLLEKELVQIDGRSDGPGRPLLYRTSEKFMDYFGLSSLKDLPKPKEFETEENQIGEEEPIDVAHETIDL